MEKSRISVLVIMIIIFCLGLLFMPQIYQQVQKWEAKKEIKVDIVKTEETDEEEKKIEITQDSEFIKNLVYPIMRNDIYEKTSFYQKIKFTTSDFSNNDILYNAFLDMYDGYLVNHSNVGCTSESKEFDAKYLMSRIKNIIGRNVNYTNETFMVPNVIEDMKYVGTWQYNIASDSYIYYGDCNPKKSNIIYLDLLHLESIETSEDNSSIYLYYNIAFASIEDNGINYNYTIYSDADMSSSLLNGIISNKEEINLIFDSLDKNLLRKYKYTFKKGLCTYDNYCFSQGEWVND